MRALTLLCGLVLTAPAVAGDLLLDVQRGHADEVLAQIDATPEAVRSTDARGFTPLHWAAIRHHEELAMKLLAAGAAANVTGADGGSPLHWACHHDQPDLVRALLAAGADPNLANQWGRTPLHAAARRNCHDVVKVLVSTGARLDAATNEGWTPLHVAARAGHAEMLALLEALGADPRAVDHDGATPADSFRQRPQPIELDRETLDEYTGDFALAPGVTMHVWRVGDQLHLMEFAPDVIDPVAPDEFLCRQEPWRVSFTRNEDGDVCRIKVDFLRRTVTGPRITPMHEYVGANRCRSCHTGAEHGHQDIQWLRSRHASAYWRLATDWAKTLVTLRPHLADIDDPLAAERCRFCHITGEQELSAQYATSFRPEAGVGCESCHGAGGGYATAEGMATRTAFVSNGGEIPSELTCRRCHRDDRFQYHEARQLIAHPMPAAE